MAERGWLTPNAGATEFLCRALLIPLDDELFYLGAVNGALNELTKAYNWQLFGSETVADTVAAMQAMYDNYATTDCIENCICEVPADPDFDLDINIRIIRRNSSGATEELVNGEWVTPTGDYEVPPVPERDEPDPVDRICLAAANAAHVLEITYEEATDAYAIAATPASVIGAILDIIITVVGAFAGPTAAAYASLGKTAWDAFYETVDTLAADVWPSDFTQELTCLLREYATDTAGVVTFDWPQARGAVTDKFIEAAGAFDADRSLLWGQIGYLLEILAEGGLNHAGATTAITTYDCDICDGWCYGFNYAAGEQSWTRVAVLGANNVGSFSTGYIPGIDAPNSISQVGARRTFTAVGVTQVVITYDLTSDSSVGQNFVGVQGYMSGVAQQSGAVTQAINTVVTDGVLTVNFDGRNLDRLDIYLRAGSFSPYGSGKIKQVVVRGEGTNPFGTDNC